jgi:hypothetical protein
MINNLKDNSNKKMNASKEVNLRPGKESQQQE